MSALRINTERYFYLLAKRHPERLVQLLKSRIEPAILTHAAEIAGQNLPSTTVIPVLLGLLRHESPLVREGAIYGLSTHDNEEVSSALRDIAEHDTSPGVRSAAGGQ